MRSFRLPDLGEGLGEAELVAWHVSPGERVVSHQPLLSVETAKAVVEIPSPWAGRIVRLLGKPGDSIKVGAPIVDFDDGEEGREDRGTVVGVLETAPSPHEHNSVPAAARTAASPAVRRLAHDLGVDLTTIQGSGPEGTVTRADIEAAASRTAPADGYEPLRGVRRTMADNMARSAREVPGSTVTDEVDVGHWQSNTDVTARLVQAMVRACATEGVLNAWYDAGLKARKFHRHIDLGIALDSADGLFVPVLRDAGSLDATRMRNELDRLKAAVAARKVAVADLTGQTITLSNFGMMGGLHAALAIVPPQVAIVGAGRIFEAIRPAGEKPALTRILPISLTFDHRVVTGGEALRFLNALVRDLSDPHDSPLEKSEIRNEEWRKEAERG